MVYNAKLPIEFFDFIVVDECHRSIYNLWKQVLEYFDAFLIGLTATPDQRTFGFFNQNIVSEYTHEEAVADGVNVGYNVYLIETKITKKGSVVWKGEYVDVREKLSRKKRWQQLDEDVAYSAKSLDDDVVNPNQIRAIIRTYKEHWPQIFPQRKEVPKTLIFAKTDSHADDIIQTVREEFAEGNAFCKKVTYLAEEDPKSVLAQFRNDYHPRIAVTTDSRPLERKPTVALKDLLAAVAVGDHDEDLFTTLAGRLGRLAKIIREKETEQFREKAQGNPIGEVVKNLLYAYDPDKIESAARTQFNIFYNQPYRRKELTYAMIKELLERLKLDKPALAPLRIWKAYERLEAVTGTNPVNELVALVSLIRRITGIDAVLTPYDKTVDRNFQAWVFQKQAGPLKFTNEQMAWLRMMKEHIATSIHIGKDDLGFAPFDASGGLGRMWQLFGDKTDEMINEINGALAA